VGFSSGAAKIFRRIFTGFAPLCAAAHTRKAAYRSAYRQIVVCLPEAYRNHFDNMMMRLSG
jgi:hypothetical protein